MADGVHLRTGAKLGALESRHAPERKTLHMRHRSLVPTLFALLLLAFTGQALAEEAAARAVVEKLHEALLGAMKSGAPAAARREALAPVIAESFDFPTICRIVTGRYWKDASEAQQARFIETFQRLSLATYASNFKSYGGERFETTAVEPDQDSQVVRTLLHTGDGKQVTLNYLLRQSDGTWRIVNVIAQGVSDLSLKRADYTAVIKSEGFDSLVNRLDKKIAETEQNP